MKSVRYTGVGRWAMGLLGLVACSSGGPDKAVDPQVLARVGEVEIAAERLDRALAKLYPDIDNRPPGVERKVLGRLIESEVLVLAARDRGLERDPLVVGELNERKRELSLEELFRRGVLKASSHVSSEEAWDYFHKHHIAEQRQLRRILVQDPPAIMKVLARVQAGEDFTELATEVTEDPKGAANGGALGWLGRLDFSNHMLRRQVFDAQIGQVIGPIQEPDGVSLIKIEAVRQVDFEAVEKKVYLAVKEAKQSSSTFKYLEELTDRYQVKLVGEALGILLGRFQEADRQMPELTPAENRKPLVESPHGRWTVGQFINAMKSEQSQGELRSLEELEQYVRRLFAFKVLLLKRAEELGIDQTEYVRKEANKKERQLLADRLRRVAVEELIDPSEEQIKQYYEQHRGIYQVHEKISILEVLTQTREEADELLAKIEAGGDISELAKRYSMRSPRIRRSGGKIRLTRPDKYGRVGLEAKDAQVGEIVGPVKLGLDQGYSVFKVLKKIPAQPQSFAEARVRARIHLKQDLAKQGFETLLTDLKKKYASNIKIYEQNLQKHLSGQV